VVNAFAALQSGQDAFLLTVKLRRYDPGDRLTDHLIGLVAEDAFRTLIP
jgi:hypothetical protein